MGLGYVYRDGATQDLVFAGTPNTGNVTTASVTRAGAKTYRGYYLMGNPYPCSLDWDLAYAAATNLLSTIQYRAATSVGDAAMVFDYYNASGHISTTNSGGVSNQNIPPLEAVWVRVNADGNSGSVTLTNSMRLHDVNNESSRLKSASMSDIFRIAVFSNGIKDEQVIAQNNNADDDFEIYDSEKRMLNDSLIAEIYTLAPTRERLVINSVKPFTG